MKSLYSNFTLTGGNIILTNIFRQLIVPWLLALLLSWILVIVWLHNEVRNQQLQQIQQLALTVNYAVQANLPANDSEQLANQLRQIHNSSGLSVQYIAAYNAQSQLIASSGTARPAPVIDVVADIYQVSSQSDGTLRAVLPVSAGLGSERPTAAPPLADNGFVVIVFNTKQPDGLLWLVPLALLTVALAVGLVVSIGSVKRGQLRLATDVELIAHHCRRLQNTGQQREIAGSLIPALEPLRHAFNDLANILEQNQQATEQLVQQLTQRAHHVTAQLAEQEQQRQMLTTKQQEQQRHLQHWFEQTMLLWHRKEQLQPAQLRRLLQMHLLAGQYQFSAHSLKGQPVVLSNWLAEQRDELNEMLPSAAISLDWQEHSANLTYTVNICQKTLKSLLQALLTLCFRIEDISKVAISLQLQPDEPQPVLRLTASCNGNGLPGHCRELIAAGDPLGLQWSDADLALLNSIKSAGAVFSSQSLDGLGCILELTVPVQAEPVSGVKMLQHILVFDADEERGQLRCSALKGLASQVSKCQKLTELSQFIEHKAFDLILLFLPQYSDTVNSQQIVRFRQLNPTILCFAAPDALPQWQKLIPDVLATQQFCLGMVQEIAEQSSIPSKLQQILVVDDNETNLAFVQVLLKNKPLVLHTATTAAEVFSLCQQQRFDMILLDIQLPDMSGVDIAKQLRQMPDYRQIPIVAFTAHAMPAEIERYREAGMDDIVFKPLEPARLDTLLTKFSLAHRQN
ncbi:response regulator [Arsukibacterium indicum]|uniref:Response regulator n=1 Tax=Arsukibacterium indicum TaxID=2848612 RepID=A0ABS6MPK7_9GAMM|nr:response regulator [Arsukibacterium indicum]MBV2130716.1 response regulator [Arsukibacterium indicum]